MADPTIPSPTPKSAQYTAPSDLKSRLKASYDAIAPRYNEWTVPHSATRLRYLDQVLAHLPTTSPASLLELGCGSGVPVTQKLLSHANFTVAANDLSSAQVALARANLQADAIADRLTLLEGDMLALEFAPASLDAVLGFYSIIHLPREEQVVMLRKIATWLKPGGWLLANFGATEGEGSEAQNWLGEEEGWMFWSGWGVEGTVEKVGDAGLEVVVRETEVDVVDGATFLWILAKKGES